MQKVFLSAKWEYLAMMNYEVDPDILKPHLPPFTELDLFEGKALVSVVGFRFMDTRVFGIKWPGHTDFDEVNLRFYIKFFDGHEWRRGVSFISEIVPKTLICTAANKLYNEHYSCAKMFNNIRLVGDHLHVEYNWKQKKEKWNSIEICALNELKPINAGSEEEFIFEHYYGYNELNITNTIEYKVEHPRWEVYPVEHYFLKCDVRKLYGNEFVPYIQNVRPHSVFLAKGSEVIVRRPDRISGVNSTNPIRRRPSIQE